MLANKPYLRQTDVQKILGGERLCRETQLGSHHRRV